MLSTCCNNKTTEHDNNMRLPQNNPSCRDNEIQKYLQANKGIHVDKKNEITEKLLALSALNWKQT